MSFTLVSVESVPFVMRFKLYCQSLIFFHRDRHTDRTKSRCPDSFPGGGGGGGVNKKVMKGYYCLTA